MISLEEIKNQLEKNGRCSSNHLLAQVAASGCNENYGVNLYQASYKLDKYDKKLMWGLTNITLQPDFSNKAQYEMMVWLESEGWLKSATKYEKS